MSGPLVLLGPQRGHPRLSQALAHHGCTGELAVITAGWRYDESDLETLQRDLGTRLTLLPLYAWFEQLCAKDPELAEAYSDRQQQIMHYKAAYRDQLKHTMAAVAAMQRRVEHNEPLYGPELRFTHEALRALDARALHRVNEIRASAPPTSKPWDLPLVRAHHDEIAAVLDRVDAVLIAGGHVGVLRNRLFFFGLDVLLPRALADGTAVFAWSAGAMALTEHIFLFYDDPPEGEGHAEVLDSGLNLAPGIRIFPHAYRRLRTSDAERMTRLVDRLRPSRLLTLEAGAWLEHTSEHGWADHSEPGAASVWDATGQPVAPASAFPLPAPQLEPGVRTVVP